MEKHIGKELRSLNNLIMRHMENSPVKKNIDSATGTNGWIISYLAESEDRNIYQRDLEKEFSITRSTASKVINLMVQKGLVERHSVDSDARLKKLTLTQKAMDLEAVMKKSGEVMEKRLLTGFSEADRQQFLAYLERMKRNISE